MTTQRWIGSPAIAVLLALAIVFLGSSCGQSTSSAILSTPSAAPSSSPVASPTPSPSTPPGGPVPAQLLGNWFLNPSASAASIGNPLYGPGGVCASPPTAANCFVQLTLTATTYQLAFLAVGGGYGFSLGNVVVNNNEIDFFNEANREGLSDCDVPGGVGRYKWTLTSGVLHFTLISEPCSGTGALPDQSWSRTH